MICSAIIIVFVVSVNNNPILLLETSLYPLPRFRGYLLSHESKRILRIHIVNILFFMFNYGLILIFPTNFTLYGPPIITFGKGISGVLKNLPPQKGPPKNVPKFLENEAVLW